MIPFSLLLEGVRIFAGSIASAIGDRVANRILTVRAECGNCTRSTTDVAIQDNATNALHCTACGYEIRQYTNATSRNIRRNKTILGACVTRPHWLEPDDHDRVFVPTFDIEVVHGRSDDLVASLHVRRFGDDEPLHFSQQQFAVHGERTRTTIELPVPIKAIPQDVEVFAVDVVLQNAWGEELDRVRRLGNAVHVR